LCRFIESLILEGNLFIPKWLIHRCRIDLYTSRVYEQDELVIYFLS